MSCNSVLLGSLVLLQLLVALVSAYPAAFLLVPSDARPTPSKRAFDRLDISPFDFGSLSKRYYDDYDELDRSKKAFDRIEESSFGLLRKRAFDRVDHGAFDFGKRSGRMKRPFDRLDGSNFGMLKKRSIAGLVTEPDLTPFLIRV